MLSAHERCRFSAKVLKGGIRHEQGGTLGPNINGFEADLEAFWGAEQACGCARPVWKHKRKQSEYKNALAYVNGVSEAIFKVGMCLPAGPYVSDEDVKYIAKNIKSAIVK